MSTYFYSLGSYCVLIDSRFDCMTPLNIMVVTRPTSHQEASCMFIRMMQLNLNIGEYPPHPEMWQCSSRIRGRNQNLYDNPEKTWVSEHLNKTTLIMRGMLSRGTKALDPQPFCWLLAMDTWVLAVLAWRNCDQSVLDQSALSNTLHHGQGPERSAAGRCINPTAQVPQHHPWIACGMSQQCLSFPYVCLLDATLAKILQEKKASSRS